MTAVTDPFEDVPVHGLVPADAGRGASLSAEIGWNQTEADWRYMLENGTGFGRSNADGRLIASAMALSYGPFGWVCMVLVSVPYRRRGLATDLMRRVVDELEQRGIVPGLDATPAGREVYRHLGFRDIYRLERLWAERVTLPAGGGETPARIQPLTPDLLDEVADYDARGFGGDRRPLLAHLLERQPRRAFVARVGEWIAGFVMARDGREVTQIGPVVAEDPDIAIALARRTLDGLSGGAVIDALEDQKEFNGWLKEAGFVFQRPYIRMLLGEDAPMDEPEFIFAPAGPELG